MKAGGYKGVHYPEIGLRCHSKTQWGPGTMDILTSKESCKTDSCANSAVIAWAGQELCLDHFFSSCYEKLDMVEPMVRGRFVDATEVRAVRAVLEECSNRALLISLRHEHLNNLDRSRLLEILLLCGDLQLLLSRSAFHSLVATGRVPMDAVHGKGECKLPRNQPADEV
jgi:hypothetical protein